MALDLQKISPNLKDILLNLKHMTPMQRFAEVSRPRYELNWRTVAGEYGMEKLERNQWLIPDAEILGVAAQTASIHEHGDTARAASIGKHSATCLENQHALVKAGALVLAEADQAEHGRGDPADSLTPVHRRSDCAEALTPTSQHLIVTSQPMTATPEQAGATVATIPWEQVQRLYSGEDRAYVAEPDVERERQHAIEMAGRISGGTDTQLNGRWEVLRDEEVMQPEVRAEIEARGGLQAIPINPEFVLARDGRMMYRAQLQHELERELRMKLGVPESYQSDDQRILWHREQLARLEKADAAPRCEHIFADGTTCRSPKLKTGRWCYAHERMKAIRPKKLNLLPMEDANSIMLNLGEIGRALIDDEISERKAGLLLYQQQQGLIALSRVTFKETDGRAMVREVPSHGGTETRRKTRKDLPRIGADERGSERKFSRELTRMKTNQEVALGATQVLQSRQKRPLLQDDKLKRRDSARRGSVNPGDESCKSNEFGDERGGGGEIGHRIIETSGDRAIGKAKPYR